MKTYRFHLRKALHVCGFTPKDIADILKVAELDRTTGLLIGNIDDGRVNPVSLIAAGNRLKEIVRDGEWETHLQRVGRGPVPL